MCKSQIETEQRDSHSKSGNLELIAPGSRMARQLIKLIIVLFLSSCKTQKAMPTKPGCNYREKRRHNDEYSEGPAQPAGPDLPSKLKQVVPRQKHRMADGRQRSDK